MQSKVLRSNLLEIYNLSLDHKGIAGQYHHNTGEMVPARLRKKKFTSAKDFKTQKCAWNEDPGDCGLFDRCIPTTRMKLAAEIYDEVADM
ncbi:hypothetical protein IGI04_020165 [Brassica rapa subsp. trilocularis]|uniref:Uncharacterized protein n=1 Tax=Brassica rapa subsp. trilocularis TaxID=1813537 RepID=A0ABQ7MKC6_BRACM|nr:hypothetical protein IGI04_020165 [Brassica rapa subsp. trilocularis]